MPRLNGSLSTRTPFAAATAAVRSTEPSSTTTTSMPGSKARSSSITPGIATSSFNAGTMATRRSSDRLDRPAAGSAPITTSDTGPHRARNAEQVEEAVRAVCVRVLVEHTLARAAAELLGLSCVRQQLGVDGDRLVGARHDAQLPLGLEPALDPFDRIGDDRRAASGELEQATRRRRVRLRMRAACHVEVDRRRRDRVRKHAEGNAPERARTTGVTAIVVAADREVGIHDPARLADQLAHPLPAELVRVP